MNKKELEVVIQRIEKWYKHLYEMVVYKKTTFNAEFGWTKDHIPFKNKESLSFRPIREGENWGKKWESAWFHLSSEIPETHKGEKLATELDFSGEGLVFTPSGEIIQGITNGAIWDQNFLRTRVLLDEKFIKDGKVELWVETAANSLFGVHTEENPEVESPKRHGWFDAKVEKIRFGIYDDDIWKLYLDARILIGLVKKLEENSVRRHRAILALNNCINMFNNSRENSQKARESLKGELSKSAAPSDLTVSAIGHAHIDTGWLWPVKETVRKCARTFATQLDLIKRYPDYIFGASQPQHYQFMKDHYPDLFQEIKKAVKSGNWEVQGGMWVEADCNLISGESMVRQFLHGKNFFKDEFDVEVDNLWLPDVFGYSAAMPQILKKSGVNYFLTQKMSWSQFNDFPHQTFNWRGIDGTEVLTHFPPENTYNSELDTEFLLPAQSTFKEKDKLDEFISLFGVGDGGGGPKPENIELGRRMANLENAPKVHFDTAVNFFDRLNGQKDKLDTWVGELYLELHRGTLTTHGLVKKQNRKLENKLRTVEMLWSCLPMDKYPLEKLDGLWKKVLLNQFHDIIPGSSINLVYQTTHKEYTEVHSGCDELLDAASKLLFNQDKDSIVLVNTLSYRWKGLVLLPSSFEGYSIVDEEGNDVLVHKSNEGYSIDVNLDGLSMNSFKKAEEKKLEVQSSSDFILENDFIKYEFDEKGALISAYDKEANKEAMKEPGNVFSLYEDIPNNWDAWDIDFFYRDALIETGAVESIKLSSSSKILKQLEISLSIGNSKIQQVISLSSHSKRLDFKTNVHWNESHKMLRVHFPVAITSDQATFDIQYGYVKRNTHRNTSWDKAKFEVVGHKYADLSDHDYGVALLNDCKYGYMVLDNILDLNLLRSPSNPDPDADLGDHEFTYSFLPHNNDLIRSNVISEASCLNQKPLLFEGFTSTAQIPVKLSGRGVELTVLKKAEKEDAWVFRVVETHGRSSHGLLFIEGSITECDLIEWSELSEPQNIRGEMPLYLKPFEVKTFKVKNS
ncbi:glycosyl hydrolase-related protein [Candidatus Marinimicrobia bacterium]|nr:glycosyl hydrolase-related protein [Candidatus Neomarinimicrobiota bacterium]